MGTVKTIGDRAKLKILDIKVNYDDTDVLGMINDILETIYQALVNVSSNFVYAIGTVTTVDGTEEYTPTFSFDGFLREGSWVDGEDTYLSQVPEADKIKWDYGSTTNQPEAFYVTEGGDVGYLWVPDDAYTIYHTYWVPLTALTDYEGDALPWGGIWNRAIGTMLILELLEVAKEDPQSYKVLRYQQKAAMEWDKAMSMVYVRGIRREKQVSNMFSIGDI